MNFFALLFCLTMPAAHANPQVDLCKSITTDADRLQCYDALFGTPAKVKKTTAFGGVHGPVQLFEKASIEFFDDEGSENWRIKFEKPVHKYTSSFVPVAELLERKMSPYQGPTAFFKLKMGDGKVGYLKGPLFTAVEISKGVDPSHLDVLDEGETKVLTKINPGGTIYVNDVFGFDLIPEGEKEDIESKCYVYNTEELPEPYYSDHHIEVLSSDGFKGLIHCGAFFTKK